jgi:hypothetical protein
MKLNPKVPNTINTAIHYPTVIYKNPSFVYAHTDALNWSAATLSEAPFPYGLRWRDQNSERAEERE